MFDSPSVNIKEMKTHSIPRSQKKLSIAENRGPDRKGNVTARTIKIFAGTIWTVHLKCVVKFAKQLWVHDLHLVHAGWNCIQALTYFAIHWCLMNDFTKVLGSTGWGMHNFTMLWHCASHFFKLQSSDIIQILVIRGLGNSAVALLGESSIILVLSPHAQFCPIHINH